MKNKSLVLPPRKLRMRVIFAIPVTIAILVLGSGVLTFHWTEGMSEGSAQERLSVLVKIFAAGGFALVCGFLLAYGITNPLKKMAKMGEEILPSTEESLPPGGNEISNLTQVFNRISFSLDRFIRDHQILENLKEGLITIDPQGRVLSCNKVAEKFFGGGLQGRLFWDVLLPGPGNGLLRGNIERVLRGETSAFFQEEKIETHDHREFTLWISLSAIEKPKGVLISFKDLEELKTIRSQIRRTETLAELGGLTSTLSHEIRNPLGSIRGLLEFLEKDIPAGDSRKTFVDRALTEIDRLAKLTEDLLDLLQIERLSLQPAVQVNEILRQILALARQEFSGKEIAVEEKYEDLPPLKADPERLTQAFWNLLRNAFQAVPEGGTLIVSSERQQGAVAVCFRNSGSYIPPEIKERLFHPFYTTKPKGTGFGLFLTHKIVGAHRGKIDVESDTERGTTFRVELPLAEGGEVG